MITALNKAYLEARLEDELEGMREAEGDRDDMTYAQGRVEMLQDLLNALAGEAE